MNNRPIYMNTMNPPDPSHSLERRGFEYQNVRQLQPRMLQSQERQGLQCSHKGPQPEPSLYLCPTTLTGNRAKPSKFRMTQRPAVIENEISDYSAN